MGKAHGKDTDKNNVKHKCLSRAQMKKLRRMNPWTWIYISADVMDDYEKEEHMSFFAHCRKLGPHNIVAAWLNALSNLTQSHFELVVHSGADDHAARNILGLQGLVRA